MPRKSYKPEGIVAKLHQVDVLTSHGQSVAEVSFAPVATREIGMRAQQRHKLGVLVRPPPAVAADRRCSLSRSASPPSCAR